MSHTDSCRVYYVTLFIYAVQMLTLLHTFILIIYSILQDIAIMKLYVSETDVSV